MVFHDDDKDRDLVDIGDEAIGEVVDKDEDEDEIPIVPIEEDEKGWE